MNRTNPNGHSPAKRPTAGRPPTGTVITVRIPDEIIAACDAQPEGRAAFIRRAVSEALSRHVTARCAG